MEQYKQEFIGFLFVSGPKYRKFLKDFHVKRGLKVRQEKTKRQNK